MSEQFKGMQWEYNRTNFDRNLAVVIGIDRYKSKSIHNLSTPVSDARALADLLETEYGYNKDKKGDRLFDENVLRLFDEAATLTGLQTLLNDTLPNRLNPTKYDRLIFYFAGHGIPRNGKDGPEGYLVPQDADSQKQDSFLPMSKVYEALINLDCHHLLVILDCCFAGTFRWAVRRKMIPIQETVRREHYDRFIRYPAWQVMTSAAHDQEALDVAKLAEDKRGAVPDEKQELHSPFALALLSGLHQNKADVIPDQVLTAQELYLYLEKPVSQWSGEHQKPGLYPMKLEYDRGEFVFTRPGFTSEQLHPAPVLNESNNPYRGLKPFYEKHAPFFFGRNTLVEQLLRRISQPNRSLTVVLGDSGSGKSSLVKAGLIPRLRYESNPEVFELNLIKAWILTEILLAAFPQFPLKFLPICYINQWYILDPMRPARSPFTELARAILPIDKPELIEQLSQVSFLDEVFKPKDESGQDDRGKPTDVPFVKLAGYWNSATPEAKLSVVEDYFQQLQARCPNSQEKQQLSQLYGAIVEKLESLSNRLKNDPQHLTRVIKKWSESHPNVKLLLTIDQFQELMTMSQESQTETHGDDETPDEPAAEPQSWVLFLQVLRQAIVECSQQLHIVLTLRSDFELRFLSPPLAAYWKNARFRVRAMNLDELRQAIEGPALKQALYFEPPELVGKLIDEVAQMPGALPLLSFTLSELYIKLHDRWVKDNATDRALRIKDYEELGRVVGSLTRRATQEYDKLVGKLGEESGKAYQATMRRVMLRMVAIELEGVVRRRVPESELVYPSQHENDQVVEVIKRLVQARLLVKGQETGEAYIELAHDFLVRGWDKLQKWIKEEQEDLALRQRLTPAANDWATGKGGLWAREIERLARLEKVLESSDNNWLNQRETEFVTKSKKQQLDELEEAKRQRDEAIQGQIGALSSLSQARMLTRDRLGALFAAVKAGIQLKGAPWLQEKLGVQTNQALEHAVYGVQELNRLEGNTDPIDGICFSPNGKMIVTANWDKTVKVWGIDGSLLKTFKGHTDRVNTVAFSSDGSLIASGSKDKTVKVWYVNEGTLRNTFQGHSANVLGVDFSLDGQIVASASEDGTVRLWNVSDGNLIKTLQSHSGVVKAVSFSPNGKIIASGGWDQPPWQGKIRLWSIDGVLLNTIDNNGIGIDSVNFSPDSGNVVTASGDGNIRLWHVAEFESFDVDTGDLRSIEFSTDQKNIICSSDNGHVKILRITDGEILTDIKAHNNWTMGASISPDGQPIAHDYWAMGARISPDGQAIASISTDKTVKLWSIDGSLLKVLSGHNDAVNGLAFSPDGKTLATTSADKTIRLWSVDGPFLKRLDGKQGSAHLGVSFSPDGKTLASASWDTTKGGWTLKLWSTNGELLKTLTGYGGSIRTLNFSSDSKLIASASWDGTVKVWTIDGELVTNFTEHGKPVIGMIPRADYRAAVNGVSFHPDGKILVSGGYDRHIRIWNLDGTQLQVIPDAHEEQIYRISFSPDGKTIATASWDRTVKLWSIEGELLQTFSGHSNWLYGLSFSPDGKMIATGSLDRTVKLWNTESGLLATLVGHNEGIYDLSFSPDSKIIASASLDKTVKLWRSRDGSLLKTISGHNEGVYGVSFSADGQIIASASGDGSIKLWSAETLDFKNLLKRGCDWLDDYVNTNPNISQEDRRLFQSKGTSSQ